MLNAEKQFLCSIIACLQQQARLSGEKAHICINITENYYQYSLAEQLQKRRLPTSLHLTPPTELAPLSKENKNPCTFPKKGTFNIITLYPSGAISPGTVYLGFKNTWYALRIEVKKNAIMRWYRQENNQWILIE